MVLSEPVVFRFSAPTRGTLYPVPVGTGPGKIKVRMISFSVIKPKIISVRHLPV